jgi:hypothetical protein
LDDAEINELVSKQNAKQAAAKKNKKEEEKAGGDTLFSKLNSTDTEAAEKRLAKQKALQELRNKK